MRRISFRTRVERSVFWPKRKLSYEHRAVAAAYAFRNHRDAVLRLFWIMDLEVKSLQMFGDLVSFPSGCLWSLSTQSNALWLQKRGLHAILARLSHVAPRCVRLCQIRTWVAVAGPKHLAGRASPPVQSVPPVRGRRGLSGLRSTAPRDGST